MSVEDIVTENSNCDLNSRGAAPAAFGRESAGSSVLAVSVISLSTHSYFNIRTIEYDFCTNGHDVWC